MLPLVSKYSWLSFRNSYNRQAYLFSTMLCVNGVLLSDENMVEPDDKVFITLILRILILSIV